MANSACVYCLKLINIILFISAKYKNKNQLHVVSRTLQGRQREPSFKKLRSLLSNEFWRHCVLNDETQCRAVPTLQSEEMKIYI